MNSKTLKACDGCRLRKVRCNGNQPCQQCDHLNLPCNFSAAKDRRQVVRGSRLAQLKSQRAQQPSPQPIASQSPPNSWDQRVYSEEFYYGLLPDYESVVYPVNPVIPRTEMADIIRTLNQDATATALVYAYAAVTINLSRISSRYDNGEILAQIDDFIARSFAARAVADANTSVTIQKIMTCIFLEICLMAFKRYDRAFVILREAISMIQVLEVQVRKEPARYGDDAAAARRQRLYWEAFVHERYLTITTSFPSVLPPLRSGLPAADPTVPAHVNIGFTRIIKLFLIMDDELLSHWAAQVNDESERPSMTASWVEHKQQQLDDDELSAAEDEGAGLTELQVADLFITRVWLRTLVWQLAMSRCLLSSDLPSSAHAGLSLAFPAQRLSTQLGSLVMRLKSHTSITLHGSAILEKLFEITNTIADVMTVVSSPELDADGNQRVWDLIFLVEMLLSFERIDQVQRDILQTKMKALKERWPGFEVPELNFQT